MKNDKLQQRKYKKGKSLLKHLGIAIIGTVAILSTYLYGQKQQKEEKENFNNLYEKVKKVADTNENAFTSHYEWAKVYNFLGKDYSVHYSDPKKDLTLEEMKKYLNKK